MKKRLVIILALSLIVQTNIAYAFPSSSIKTTNRTGSVKVDLSNHGWKETIEIKTEGKYVGRKWTPLPPEISLVGVITEYKKFPEHIKKYLSPTTINYIITHPQLFSRPFKNYKPGNPDSTPFVPKENGEWVPIGEIWDIILKMRQDFPRYLRGELSEKTNTIKIDKLEWLVQFNNDKVYTAPKATFIYKFPPAPPGQTRKYYVTMTPIDSKGKYHPELRKIYEFIVDETGKLVTPGQSPIAGKTNEDINLVKLGDDKGQLQADIMPAKVTEKQDIVFSARPPQVGSYITLSGQTGRVISVSPVSVTTNSPFKNFTLGNGNKKSFYINANEIPVKYKDRDTSGKFILYNATFQTTVTIEWYEEYTTYDSKGNAKTRTVRRTKTGTLSRTKQFCFYDLKVQLIE